MAREDDPVDGSIEGLNVSHFAIRLTGQDVERGTFNQRHAVFYDQATGARVANMRHLDIAQDPVEVHNSPLNEAAVLGFEYGYSVAARKRTLVLWEAQFGDFANGAQVRGRYLLGLLHLTGAKYQIYGVLAPVYQGAPNTTYSITSPLRGLYLPDNLPTVRRCTGLLLCVWSYSCHKSASSCHAVAIRVTVQHTCEVHLG